MNLYLWLLVGIAWQVPYTQAAQILGLFTHPGKSHFDFFRPLFVGLSAAGHNVTMISYFPNRTPIANYTDLPLSGMPIIADIVDLQVFDDRPATIPIKIPTFFMLHGWGMQACEVAFEHDVIKGILHTPLKFDVVILEEFANDCMHAVAHLLQAPVIGLSSCAIMPWHYRIGNPFIPSYMPMNFLGYSDEMNFVERVNNFLHYHAVGLLYSVVTQRQTNALIGRHFGDRVPPVQELVKRTSLMLINQHFSLTGAYPNTPNVVNVGGLQIQDAAPLPAALQALLDKSAMGVIYISWGSMIRPDTLPAQKRDEIMQTIRQLPQYTFLMKWPNATLPNRPANLHTREWMPQRDILCHPQVKAFMSHGGLLGLSEAVYCGVPVVVTPFYGDQFLNAAAVAKRNLGVVVNYSEFTAQRLQAALKSILEGRFERDMARVSQSYRQRPVEPLQLAIWWVEHVIATEGAQLAQSSSLNLNWFVYNAIDIYCLVVVVLALILYCVKMAVKFCISRFFCGKKQQQQQQQQPQTKAKKQ